MVKKKLKKGEWKEVTSYCSECGAPISESVYFPSEEEQLAENKRWERRGKIAVKLLEKEMATPHHLDKIERGKILEKINKPYGRPK